MVAACLKCKNFLNIDGKEPCTVAQEMIDFIDENKNGVKDFLEPELYSRYYYQKDRIKHQLQKDPWIDSAIALFNNKDKYSNILKGLDGNHRTSK